VDDTLLPAEHHLSNDDPPLEHLDPECREPVGAPPPCPSAADSAQEDKSSDFEAAQLSPAIEAKPDTEQPPDADGILDGEPSPDEAEIDDGTSTDVSEDDLPDDPPQPSPAERVLSLFAPFWSSTANLSRPELLLFPTIALDTVDSLIADSVCVLRGFRAVIGVASPVVVVGDLHGSLPDLLRLLQGFGAPPETRYLFLGDYVDRGAHSVAVLCLVLSLMCRFPSHVFLLRGNHEFPHINRVYGFWDEVMLRYKSDVLWSRFQEVFSWMPLAAIIDRSVFCVHGGLSPLLDTPQALAALEMPILNYLERPLISDVVWSDPIDVMYGFQLNNRGSGRLFGPDKVEDFLRRNNMKLLVRAHQCNQPGFRTFANMMGVTIFSSSNYCNLSDNKCGAMVMKSEKEISFFSIDPESDLSFTPRMIMLLGAEGDLGLKRLFRTTSMVFASDDDNDDDLIRMPQMKRSGSVTSRLAVWC
jgi:diadenosine tetraphosphatase ApaH/serine/threonine PP2A family protein phosphatase